MAKTLLLLFLTCFLVAAVAEPRDEEALIAELKRILEVGQPDNEVDTAAGTSTGVNTGTVDDDKEEELKEEELNKELAEEEALETAGTGVDVGTQTDGTGVDVGTQTEGTGVDVGTQTDGTGVDVGTQTDGTGVDGGTQTEGTGVDVGTQTEGTGVDGGTQTDGTGVDVGTQTEIGGQQGRPKGVQDMLHKGWDMLDELQRVSVAFNLENRPISDNKSPKAALHDVLVEIFEFDGLANKVIHSLIQRLSPTTDMCSQMFSEGEERTLERVTNCFIMRFTQVLSLVEHLEKVNSASELEVEDLIRLTTLERDLLQVSYEIFKILKSKDPSVALPDIIGDKEATLVAMQEGDAKLAGSITADGSSSSEVSGNEEATGKPSNPEEEKEEEEDEEEEEKEKKENNDDKRFLRKEFFERLARRLEKLIDENER